MVCRKCGASDRFPSGSCRPCHKSAGKAWFLLNKDSQRERTKEWRLANRARYRWLNLRRRAKTSGIPFNLTIDDMVVPQMCPVLGIPMRHGGGKVWHNSPTVDRIDPKGGYVKGNIRVISHRANAIKSDATSAEIRRVLKYVEAEERARGKGVRAGDRLADAQMTLEFGPTNVVCNPTKRALEKQRSSGENERPRPVRRVAECMEAA